MENAVYANEAFIRSNGSVYDGTGLMEGLDINMDAGETFKIIIYANTK